MIPLKYWLADVRSIPRHIAFAMGDHRGDPAVVRLRNGGAFRGALAVNPDVDGFRLVTEPDDRGDYYHVDEFARVKSVWISYCEVAEVRCGRFVW